MFLHNTNLFLKNINTFKYRFIKNMSHRYEIYQKLTVKTKCYKKWISRISCYSYFLFLLFSQKKTFTRCILDILCIREHNI
ncbi:hypothetical protein M153_28890001423 [Pseudoloma neurophilia]|uniref:Uncharacterized protein n=1 Tax=Pseudoloma neurophilia TaxID=146866 RepID=A0A0R0LY05_9MICR|nr:hypothetical protein M153_28890001423 [Pseudoloma neurophilia]